MTHIINLADLPHSETAYEFQVHHYDDARVSFFLVDALPGSGPKLHKHPYEEVFVVHEGTAMFTAGDDTSRPAVGRS